MDPTAPKDNPQGAQSDDSQDKNPVQPGQFVVSGEPRSPSPNQDTSSSPSAEPSFTPPTSTASAEPSAPPNPNDLQADLKSTVEAATGTNLAGQPQSQKPSLNIPNEGSAAASQPDPTPFVQPGSPGPAGQPGTQIPPQTNQDSKEGGSSGGKMKTILIVLGVFLLVAILAAVAWYFILGSNSTEETTTTDETITIEEPVFPSPSPITGGGFGELPEPSPEPSDEILDDTPPDILEEELIP